MAVPSAPIALATPEMPALLTEIVSKIVISSLRVGRFFTPQGAVLYETYPSPGHKDTYTFASYQDLLIDPTALATYVLAEGVTPTPTAFGSDVNSFVTTEYARLVTVTSEQLRTNPHGFFGIVADKVANAALDLIDAVASSIWGVYAAVAPVILPGATPAATNPLDTTAILKAKATLETFGVKPIDGSNYGAMVTPAVGATLQLEAGPLGWTDAIKYAGPDRLITGEIGAYRGFRFFSNPRIPGKTATVFPSYFFGAEALAFADLSSLRVTSVPPTPTITDPLAQRGAAGFACRGGGMLITDLTPDTTKRRSRFVVVESTAATGVAPAAAVAA